MTTERYGRKDLAPDIKEKVRSQILVCIRVAKILKLCTDMKAPFIFETAVFYERQTSVMHSDEYETLRATPGVHHKRGAQCPFGSLPSKCPTNGNTHCIGSAT